MSSFPNPIEQFEYFWALLKPIWRLCLVMCVIQLLGGIVGILIAPVGFFFIDFWYGGAFATPLGFIVGSLWQFISSPGSLHSNRYLLIFLALGSILLPLSGMLMFDLVQTEFADWSFDWND